jgi:alpha-L-rhamnosidase
MTTRRRFLTQAAGGSALLGLLPVQLAHAHNGQPSEQTPPLSALTLPEAEHRLDLTPARWVWYPSERTLPNSVVLFRHAITVSTPLRTANGWIAADSRYLLTIDGTRVQWGPAPADPRRMEVDPLELRTLLTPGEHTIGVTVLYYGGGDGTHPVGKPGFIFSLAMTGTDGTTTTVVSDASWQCHLSTAWPAGNYKRWYLRAFQEMFDARKHPWGWDRNGFTGMGSWLHAMLLDCPASLPPSCSTYPDHLLDTRATRADSCLIPRSIPMLREHPVPVERLAEAYTIRWKRPAEEYFDVLPPDAFSATPLEVRPAGAAAWTIELDGETGKALTFVLRDQHVGFPYFTIDAPSGTIVELMVQEGHTAGGPPLLNSHFHAWARFICAGGEQTFQTLDFEAARWIQLHVRGAAGRVTIRNVGMLRRVFPWPIEPRATVNEPGLQRLMDACVNTLYNSAQETTVDGMGRERQQYSGDGAHQLHAAYMTFGEHRIGARFIQTFSQGLMLDGYFFDCWPAYDRLARVMERQLNMTPWGPLLDHSIGFGFDIFHHHLYSGDLAAVREPFIRYQRFVLYLHSIRLDDGLLAVTDLGTPAIWIDHVAYQTGKPLHKQCAFNLYAAAMLQHAFAPVARALGAEEWAGFAENFGRGLQAAVVESFWSEPDGLFIINKPWLSEGEEPRLCDRSLATAVIFDQCPGGKHTTAVNALASPPPNMGISYPANACWRYWALARGGRMDIVVRDFRERWATMPSVLQNNTIFENWTAAPDSGDLWSHCAVVPLYLLTQGIAGIRPTAPGFARCMVRPQPADLEHVSVTVPAQSGVIELESTGVRGDRTLRLKVPRGCIADLVVDEREQIDLTPSERAADPGLRCYRFPSGKARTLHLRYT